MKKKLQYFYELTLEFFNHCRFFFSVIEYQSLNQLFHEGAVLFRYELRIYIVRDCYSEAADCQNLKKIEYMQYRLKLSNHSTSDP